MTYLDQFPHEIKRRKDKSFLVALHGLMGNYMNWKAILSDFQDDFSSLSYTQRGHKNSIQEKSYQIKDYVSDLNKIYEQTIKEEFFLLGHSLGGRIAMDFAINYPEKLKKLIIVDISPGSTPTRDFLKKLFDATPSPFETRQECYDFFHLKLPKLFVFLKKEIIAFLYSNMIQTKDGKWDWAIPYEITLESISGSEYLWEKIHLIKTPSLIIRGEKSLDFTKEQYEKMLSLNSLFRGVIIPEASHWVHVDQKNLFIKEVKSFLSE